VAAGLVLISGDLQGRNTAL